MWPQARHRAPKLETFLRNLEDCIRAALLRDLQGTLSGFDAQVLHAFGG